MLVTSVLLLLTPCHYFLHSFTTSYFFLKAYGGASKLLAPFQQASSGALDLYFSLVADAREKLVVVYVEPKCDVELESNLRIDVINTSYNDENHENLQRTRTR